MGSLALLAPDQCGLPAAGLAHQDHWQTIPKTLLDAHELDEVVHLGQITHKCVCQSYGPPELIVVPV